jgi:hypothetical protein
MRLLLCPSPANKSYLPTFMCLRRLVSDGGRSLRRGKGIQKEHTLGEATCIYMLAGITTSTYPGAVPTLGGMRVERARRVTKLMVKAEGDAEGRFVDIGDYSAQLSQRLTQLTGLQPGRWGECWDRLWCLMERTEMRRGRGERLQKDLVRATTAPPQRPHRPTSTSHNACTIHSFGPCHVELTSHHSTYPIVPIARPSTTKITAMASLRTQTGAAARLLRSSPSICARSNTMASQRRHKSDDNSNTALEKTQPAPPATRPANAPDYGVHIDKATSYVDFVASPV